MDVAFIRERCISTVCNIYVNLMFLFHLKG